MMKLDRITIGELVTRLPATKFWGLLSAIVVVIGGAFGIGYYFATQRAEVEIARRDFEIQKIKEQWATLEPQLSLKRYFDLKKQVISINEGDIPTRSALIDREFLARTNLPGLTYSKMSESELSKQIGAPIQFCQGKAIDLGPIHVWKGSPLYSIKLDREKFLNNPPTITVRKIPKARLEKRFLELLKCYQTSKDAEFKISKELGEPLEKFATANLRRVDLVGLLYAFDEFTGYFRAAFDADYNWKSNIVEKQEGFLYGTVLNTRKNVDIFIDGKPVADKELYTRVQTILVEVMNYIYEIAIFSPSLNPTVDVAFTSTTNQWLTDLRLFTD
jgi:hypothetical protein